MSKLTNALIMLDILSARSVVSVSEIASLLELSERGVQRLKLELESVGYQIETVMGPGGGYALTHKAQIEPQAFTFKERKMMKQAFALLIADHGHIYGRDFSIAISKLSHQLDYDSNIAVSAFQSVQLNLDFKAYQTNIDALTEAIESHRRIIIVYDKNHRERREYRFEPYELVMVNRFWYVVGYDKQNRLLSLKVSRIHTITTLDETFRYDEDTTSRGIFNDFGYKIKPVKAILEISNRDYVSEYVWGEQQEICWLNDHKLKLSVIFSNEYALKDFVMRGGSDIKVIEPEWLKNEIVEEIRKMLEVYDY